MGGVVPRAGRHGESIPTTAHSVTAAVLHRSCRRSPKITWTSAACRSWVSPQVPVTDSGRCLPPGSQRTRFVPKCCFALAEPLGGERSAPAPLSPPSQVGCRCLPVVGLVCSYKWAHWDKAKIKPLHNH